MESAIEDLEMKNRLLVDKLNAQIYKQATSYKEKTLNALNRGRDGQSHSPLRASGIGGTQGDSAFARSPL